MPKEYPPLSLVKSPRSTTIESRESRMIVQLLSIIYEPVGITKLTACIKQLGITQDNGRQHHVQSIKLTLAPLIKENRIIENHKLFSCPLNMMESNTREAIENDIFQKIVAIIRLELPLDQYHWNGPKSANWRQAVREVRIALYSNDEQETLTALDECEAYYPECTYENPLIPICFQDFNPQSFLNLPATISSIALAAIFKNALSVMHNLDEILDWVVEAHKNNDFPLNSDVIYEISKYLIFKGESNKALSLATKASDYHNFMIQGCASFLQNENSNAITHFEHSLVALKKLTRKRVIFIDAMSGVFFILSLFQRGKPNDIQQIRSYLTTASKSKNHSTIIYELFSYLLDFTEGHPPPSYYFQSLQKWPAAKTAFEYYLTVLILSWTERASAKMHTQSLQQCINDIQPLGYQWLLSECELLLNSLNNNDKNGDNSNQNNKLDNNEYRKNNTNLVCMIDIIKIKEPWERTLEALSSFKKEQPKEVIKKKSRLIWILSMQDTFLDTVTIKEQKQNIKGGWSSGRQVALKRLSEDPESFDCLTEKDAQASKAIFATRDYWGVHYEINESALLPLLVGHPLLFSAENNNPRIELLKGSAEIQVIKRGNYLTICMTPDFSNTSPIVIKKTAETQWKVIESTPEQQHLASLIGEGLKIPASAKEQVLSSMNAIAPFVEIHSDIGGGSNDAESVKADSQLHLLLSPLDDGLKIEGRIQAFGPQSGKNSPYYTPGTGGKTIIAEIDGQRLQTTRNLNNELQNVQTLLNLCPQLKQLDNSLNEWLILDPETCLEILLELQTQTSAIVSWPEGEKLKVTQSIGLSDLKVSVKKDNDWFSAVGEIKLDDGQIVNMQRLMLLTNNATGRFISLKDGQFIALTDTFKSRISDLQTFGEIQNNKLKLHPLAALALDDLSEEVASFKSDKNWKSYITRFHEAMNLTPAIPSTLQTELRDYQKEGFQWLVRLAHWGAGACLADDMGLGKTIQTIALLLYRATEGPALIIAPTSVAMNWMSEISRFAPTLNIIDYRESKRDKVLNNLNNFDVVICSYGLIQNNIEKIEVIQWSTVVLDEAQAIKNSATKRSQAIMKIQSTVKVILTGTPIENHLGELWNLFRFINPGLLGSMESFNTRYATPITKDASFDIQQKLKKLIHPYILRRTKTEVLTELPSRTDISLHVEMSKEEEILYETLRRDAVEKMTESNQPKGQRQLQILAEITRLRRACCNPSLVLKTGAPKSSKLALFVNVVKELLDNHHKALVFSQFVDHLSILRNALDDMKVNYQYLDGSTPAKKRKQIVTDFQAGIGDIFLISLKAGGVGLNLTAADYVIHMDPWWNPAVEDQASDRAHRIGQKRPVTVYRMITKNTIEEKIVALHKGKRDLADNLLAGSNIVGKVDVEELLNLLQDN